MDDFVWHARGQLCEQHATARNGQRHIYRIGVFERKEYAARAAECVTACMGIDSIELRTHGVVPLTSLVKASREHLEVIEAARRLVAALEIRVIGRADSYLDEAELAAVARIKAAKHPAKPEQPA